VSEERRLVTILFADVVGSTSLGESLDPEDVRARGIDELERLGDQDQLARVVAERSGSTSSPSGMMPA
jgi:class 3 adenylate cyclase